MTCLARLHTHCTHAALSTRPHGGKEDKTRPMSSFYFPRRGRNSSRRKTAKFTTDTVLDKALQRSSNEDGRTEFGQHFVMTFHYGHVMLNSHPSGDSDFLQGMCSQLDRVFPRNTPQRTSLYPPTEACDWPEKETVSPASFPESKGQSCSPRLQATDGCVISRDSNSRSRGDTADAIELSNNTNIVLS